jgi:hypothetical protein
MRTLVILILIGFCLSGWSGLKPNLEMKGKWAFGPKETGGGTAVVKWVNTVAADGGYHRLLTLTTSNKVTEVSEAGILELKNGRLTETMTNLQFVKALPWVRMPPLTNTNRFKIVDYDGTNLTLAVDFGGTKQTVIWRRTE